MSKDKKGLVLLDADYLVFSCLQAAETETDWGDDVWTLECDHKQALRALKSRTEAILELITAELFMDDFDVGFIFSDAENWRKAIYPNYKFNRRKEGVRKPVGYNAFVERVQSGPEAFGGTFSLVRPLYEADDTCATLATDPEMKGRYAEIVTVSVDKDFYTIPDAWFYHLKVDGTEPTLTLTSQQEADLWHLYQGMKGDITDGFGGIKGVGETVNGTCIHEWLLNPTLWVQYEHEFKSGPRKGTKEMRWRSEDPREHGASLWDCIVAVGAKAEMTEDEVLVGFQMARLLRHGDSTAGWKPEDTPFVLEPII